MQDLVLEFYWTPPGDIIAMSHSGQIPMARTPVEIKPLPAIGAYKQLFLTAIIRDADDVEIGTISELEVFPDADAFEIYTTVVLSGRGTLVSYQTKSQKQLMAPFAKVIETGEAWVGKMSVPQTTGPTPDGKGTVIAATGAFAGMTGYHQQEITYSRISATGAEGRTCERFTLSAKVDD